jgi:integrase
MFAGHLQEKKGLYYLVISYPGRDGKRKNKWVGTGLPTKGNKKRAEALLTEARKNFVPDELPLKKEILFADFLEEWLEIVRHSIQKVTYSSYSNALKGVVIPYFREKGITLSGLHAKDIQDFYQIELKRVTACSVIHYHANIHKALKYAVKIDLIPVNPADRVERPRIDRFIGSFYDSIEMNRLFDVIKETKLDMPVLLGAFYGLRRSEAIGLKWNAIDFNRNTLTIQHTVVSCNLDGHMITIESDSTKTRSSMRTLPLVPEFREKLLTMKARQEEYRRICGRSYCTDYLDYVCVDEMGERIKPGFLTTAFQRLLEENGLRKIRYHDLRHSCASLLLANGVPMKQIQEWLGHSDFSTTANIYTHLDVNSKLTSAQAMVAGLKWPSSKPTGTIIHENSF